MPHVICSLLAALWPVQNAPHSVLVDPDDSLRNAISVYESRSGKRVSSKRPTVVQVRSSEIDLDLGYFDTMDLCVSVAKNTEEPLRLYFGVEEDAFLAELLEVPEQRSEIDLQSDRFIAIPSSELIRDGAPHTYRLDLGLVPEWRGRYLRRLALVSPSRSRLRSVVIGDDPSSPEPVFQTEEINHHVPKRHVLWDESWQRAESKHGVVVWDDSSLERKLPKGLSKQGRITEPQMRGFARNTLRMIEESFQVYHKKLGYDAPLYRDRTEDRQAYKTMCTTWYPGFWMGATPGGLPYFNVGVNGMLDEGWGSPVPHEYAHCFQGGQSAILAGKHWESHANYLRDRRNAHFPKASGGSGMPAKVFRRSNVAQDHGYHIYGDYRIHLGLSALAESGDFPGIEYDLWNEGDEKLRLFDKLGRLCEEGRSRDVLAAAYARTVMMDVPDGDWMLNSRQVHGLDGRSNKPWFDVQQGSNLEVLAEIDGKARRFPYRVPLSRAPMPFAYMWHELTPIEPGSGTIAVELRGMPTFSSAPDDWRFVLVAVSDDGEPRYSPAFPPAARGSLKLREGETSMRIVVTSTPEMPAPDTTLYQDQADWGRDPRFRRYPYELSIEGAVPAVRRFEVTEDLAGALRPHPNGGGLVSASAKVSKDAYIGPNALVLGDAEITGQAIIDDYAVIGERASISGDAVVRGFATVRRAEVKEHALVEGHAAIEGGAISGNARFIDHTLLQGGKSSAAEDAYVVGTAHVMGKDANLSGDAVIEFDAANIGPRTTGFVFNSVPWGGWYEPYRQTLTKEQGLLAAYPILRAKGAILEAHRGAGHSILENDPLRAFDEERGSLALSLNGNDQSVTLDRRFAAARHFTFAAWVRSTPRRGQPLLFIGNDRGDALSLDHRGALGLIEVVLSFNGKDVKLTSRHSRKEGWEHVALSLGQGKLRLYVDGSLQDEARTPVEVFQLAPKAAGLAVNSAYVGRDRSGQHFEGKLDNIKIFNQVLDKQRISSAMKEDDSPRELIDFRVESKKAKKRSERKR